MAKQRYTEAKKAANKKWDEANRDKYARISLVVHAELKKQIQARCMANGQSVNSFIIEAIKDKI